MRLGLSTTTTNRMPVPNVEVQSLQQLKSTNVKIKGQNHVDISIMDLFFQNSQSSIPSSTPGRFTAVHLLINTKLVDSVL
jgi:hypothetical protein